MANVYFKGLKVWHTVDGNVSGTKCTRCGFEPKIEVVTMDAKADADPDCQAIPASIQQAMKRNSLGGNTPS